MPKFKLTGGKVLLVDGKPTTGENCCCCESLPDSLNLTISGIERCDDCLGSDPFWSKATAMGDINGAFTGLNKVSDHLWRKDIGTVTIGSYSDAGCSTAFGSDVNYCTAFLRCIDGANSLNIRGTPSSFPVDDADGIGLWSASGGSGVIGVAWPALTVCGAGPFYLAGGNALVEIPEEEE